jgi:ABC-type multidrug transport system ATPase subunit
MAAPAIEFADVTKVYQRRFARVRVPALASVSFEVARAEVCAFLGPKALMNTDQEPANDLPIYR